MCDFTEQGPNLLSVLLLSKNLQKLTLRKGTFDFDTLCRMMEELPVTAPALKSLSLHKIAIAQAPMLSVSADDYRTLFTIIEKNLIAKPMTRLVLDLKDSQLDSEAIAALKEQISAKMYRDSQISQFRV